MVSEPRSAIRRWWRDYRNEELPDLRNCGKDLLNPSCDIPKLRTRGIPKLQICGINPADLPQTEVQVRFRYLSIPELHICRVLSGRYTSDLRVDEKYEAPIYGYTRRYEKDGTNLELT